MDENNEWGQTYISEYGITKITSNMQQIPQDWTFRFCYKDEKGNIYLKPEKGRKLCIEINPGLDAGGESSSNLLATIRELRKIDLNELESVCSKIEKRVYEKLNKKKV